VVGTLDERSNQTTEPARFPLRNLVFVLVLAAAYQVFIFFAYPLASGPDGWTFFCYADQLFSGVFYCPIMMRMRTAVYPLFLGGLTAILGENATAIVVVHHLLALVFIALLFATLLRFGLRFATVVSALVAVAPQVMDHFHFCSSEPLYLVLLAAAVLSTQKFFERRTAGWAVGAGLSISLTALCRPVFGPLSTVLLVWLLVRRSRWWVRALLVASWLAPTAACSTLNYFKQGFFAPHAAGGIGLASGTLWHHKVSQPDDGPYTAQLYEDLADDWKAGRTTIEWSPETWRTSPRHDELMAEALRLLSLRYGYDEADRRLAAIGRESALHHPFALAWRTALQMAKFLRFPSRLMRSYFAEMRPLYAKPRPTAIPAAPDYDKWVYSRPWPDVNDRMRNLLLERVRHYSVDIWSARPVGNPLLLSLLDEWENIILLPGLWLAVFSVAALVFLWRSAERDILLLYAFIVLGHAFVTSLVLHVSNRYVAVVLPWYIALAALGVRESLNRYAAALCRKSEGGVPPRADQPSK